MHRTVSDRRPAEEARLPVDLESVEDTLAYLCLGKFKSDAEGDPAGTGTPAGCC